MTTLSPVERIIRVLHSRGREATPEQVREWIDRYKTATGVTRCSGGEIGSDGAIARAVEQGLRWITMSLHNSFGEPLKASKKTKKVPK